jgi:hypothetical protein
MPIGFSTGSIAHGDFKTALRVLQDQDIRAIELSALREDELQPLFLAINDLDLAKYDYVSVHAPGKITCLAEEDLVEMLMAFAEKTWPIVVHPDIICDAGLWRILGNKLCIENMDKRKPCGRTMFDLKGIFGKLPEAGFCLDLAHAKQVDPTMTECYLMIREFKDKLLQLHVSDVTTESKHIPLNEQAIMAYRKIAKYLPEGLPVILESPVPFGVDQKEGISNEIVLAAGIFQGHPSMSF